MSITKSTITQDSILQAYTDACAQYGEHAQLPKELRALLARYFPQVNQKLATFKAASKVIAQGVQAPTPSGQSRFLDLKKSNPSNQVNQLAVEDRLVAKSKVIKQQEVAEDNEPIEELNLNSIEELVGKSIEDLSKYGRAALQEVALKAGFVINNSIGDKAYIKQFHNKLKEAEKAEQEALEKSV